MTCKNVQQEFITYTVDYNNWISLVESIEGDIEG